MALDPELDSQVLEERLRVILSKLEFDNQELEVSVTVLPQNCFLPLILSISALDAAQLVLA